MVLVYFVFQNMNSKISFSDICNQAELSKQGMKLQKKKSDGTRTGRIGDKLGMKNVGCNTFEGGKGKFGKENSFPVKKELVINCSFSFLVLFFADSFCNAG